MDKRERYEQLLQEIKALVSKEFELVSNLANVTALIKERTGFFWVGFYLVGKSASGGKELKLGPFQGPVACYTIGYGKGVCGAAWRDNKSYVVEDVHLFPGHIACSSLSESEIVVPLHNAEGEVVGVLDIDSDARADFDTIDQRYLEEICSVISSELFSKFV